jgi:hypothetical protein
VNWVHPTRLPIVNIEQLSPVEIAQHMIRGIDAANVGLKHFEIQNTFPPNQIEGYAYLPAIAIPVPAKPMFECPQDHLNVLTEAIPQVDRLIVVGWRGGREQHFTGLFRKLQRFVSVIIGAGSEKDAQQTEEELQKAGVRGHYNRYFGGFSKFIKHEQALDALLSTQVSQIR